jgi:glycosyltransferase involved in cell wall biosynthesis
MHVVLAHDSFTQLGGAERVFLEMANMYPEAPIYVVVADPKILAQLPESIRDRVHTSPLQGVYNLYPKFQHLLPLIPLALWYTSIPKCDVLLSSSSAFAKGFRKPKGAVHIDYCHTPTRFLWSDRSYIGQEVPWLLRPLANLFLGWMRRWDLRVTKQIDLFLANSKEVQERIQKYYGRTSELVYPFVDTEFWKPGEATGSNLEIQNSKSMPDSNASSPDVATSPKYFLIAGRLHAHKCNDLVIRVFNKLGFSLHVVGSGRDEEHLRSIAGPKVKFLGRLDDVGLREEYRGAEAYVWPQLEDFGIMPLEAAGCGTPTIAANVGGALETVVAGKTGEFFEYTNEADLERVLLSFDATKYDLGSLVAQAEKFSLAEFQSKIQDSIKAALI